MRVLEMNEKRSSHTLCDIFMKPPDPKQVSVPNGL